MKEIGVIDLMITAHQHQTIIGNDFETVYVQRTRCSRVSTCQN